MFKKTLKWIGRVVVSLVVLAALFYIVENVRGKRVWEQYKRECAARGENIGDWQSLVPPPIPDEDNIAMAPIFQDLLADPPKRTFRLPPPPRLSTNTVPCSSINTVSGFVWQGGERGNLDRWRVALSNDNLLAALSVYDDDLREIEEAIKRPSFRYEGWDRVNVSDPFSFVHIRTPIDLARMYSLLTRVRHEAGQHNGMLESLQTGLHIVNRTQENASAICATLVRAGTLEMMCSLSWLGISGRVWDAQQLAALQNILDEINLAEHVVRSIRFERSLYISLFLSSSRSDIYHLYVLERPPIRFYLMPRGWFYQGTAHFAALYGRREERLIHADSRWFDVSQLNRTEEEQDNLYFFFLTDTWTVDPLLSSSIKRIAYVQATLHQATLACAIERYRLEHGRIPERLDELVPQFLAKVPCDPCDGQPMRYKIVDDGEYILYSIGWNDVDDNGELAWKPNRYNKPTTVDYDEGDWIWRSAPPPKAAVNEELENRHLEFGE